jgi:hypothetical protein
MIPWPDRIPDAIEPLLGYRMWGYDLRDRRTELHSITCSGHCPWEDAGSQWVVASCNDHVDGGHAAPEEDCSCGIYAMSDLRDLGYPHAMRGRGFGKIVGRVELAGKIIEHEFGLRAERARIAEFLPFEGQTRDVMRLANRLGLPMASPLPPPQTLTPPGPLLRVLSWGYTPNEIAEALAISREAVRREASRDPDAPAGRPSRQGLGPWPPPRIV